jgi:type II secretory pathway component GspD/PulD (secretin)
MGAPRARTQGGEREMRDRNRHARLLACLMLGAASMELTAQETRPAGGNTNVSEFIELPVDDGALPEAETEANAANLISISLDDVEMLDVVRMFSRISGANIIATPSNLTSRVTANLDGVEWKPALTSILSMHGLALLEKTPGSGVFSIVTRPPDAPDPLVVRTLFLKYTTVSDVVPVVKSMLPENGSVSVFSSRSAIVVRSTEASLNEIERVIQTIDIQSKQVCIETQFMELTDEASKQIGIKWDSLEAFNVGFQAGPFVSQESLKRDKTRTDTMTLSDSRSRGDSVDKLYNMYNGQYQVESVEILERPDGTFVESSKTDPTRRITDSIDLTSKNESSIGDAFAKSISESKAAILNMDSLNVMLSALKRTDGVSIISNPKMIVTSGTTNAFFRVGQREPIIKTTTRRGTTDSPGDEITANLDTQTSTEYIKNGYLHTGIELTVVPTVKTDDLIEAEITPSLRRKVSDKTVQGNSWPVISVKEIRTLFTLKSDQTVAIGGLTDTKSDKKVSKIPLLGDIPLIGKYLFSHTREIDSQVETIIFVSLSIADPRGLSDHTGIPGRAELVHKQMIQSTTRKAKVEDEIRRIREAASRHPGGSTAKSRSGLFEKK